jgi:hypothetical protein
MIDLEEKFPKTHEHLKRTKVVTHALVYEWEGSDPSLKPLLLTGHQGESTNRSETDSRCGTCFARN